MTESMMESTLDQMENQELETFEVEALDDSLLFEGAQDVEVSSERTEGRERQISARIQIPYSVEQVWQILTDYDHLADFIPNLSKSQRIEHPQNGIRIEQIGAQALLRFKFCARVVLDMVEQFPNQLQFQMVEGDFKRFYGSWNLESVQTAQGPGTSLSYTVRVLPHRAMPVALIERKLKNGLVVNLSAIQRRANELFGTAP
jgi:ribosome-associated toxin RatA of RatAB toxin-antitoxin module